MSDNVPKFALGLIALVMLWIGVYWWWEPSEPAISFGTAPPTSEQALAEADAVRADTAEILVAADRSGPDAAANPPIVPAPRVVVEPPEFDEYTVKTGDTLRSISLKYFGTVAHAPAIARANPFMDPRRLRAGRPLRIPKDPGNIQGRPVPTPEMARGERVPQQEATAGQRTHTVRSGDTLSGIAKGIYGSSAKADLIYNANRDRLKDRDDLKIGTVLVIPDAGGGH